MLKITEQCVSGKLFSDSDTDCPNLFERKTHNSKNNRRRKSPIFTFEQTPLTMSSVSQRSWKLLPIT